MTGGQASLRGWTWSPQSRLANRAEGACVRAHRNPNPSPSPNPRVKTETQTYLCQFRYFLIMPLFCMNVWEHTWRPQYKPQELFSPTTRVSGSNLGCLDGKHLY